MKITKESTGQLTASLRIEIAPDDYSATVEKQLADYRRKANIPGFRPGHIPAGLIKKMYGKAILADEVNKLISESLTGYIRDEKIDILGNPLADIEKTPPVDFDSQDTFEFYFDLGLAPEFSIPLSEDLAIDHYSIQVDDEMINKYIEDTRKRLGKTIPAETPVADEPAGESSAEDVPTAPEPVVEPAEMNAEFFDKVFPGKGLQTEEEFREMVKNDAAMSFAAESDKLLFDDITRALVKHTEMALPDDFLKRWLVENNEGKYTPEELEKNYDSFAESMRWQLIENKLIKESNIVVAEEDIRNYIRIYMLRQLNMENADPEMQQRYESLIDTLMQNKEQVQRINDQLYNAKLMDFFRTNVTVHPKEVSYEEYIALASARHTHAHNHDHDHGHDHSHEHDHTH